MNKPRYIGSLVAAVSVATALVLLGTLLNPPGLAAQPPPGNAPSRITDLTIRVTEPFEAMIDWTIEGSEISQLATFVVVHQRGREDAGRICDHLDLPLGDPSKTARTECLAGFNPGATYDVSVWREGERAIEVVHQQPALVVPAFSNLSVEERTDGFVLSWDHVPHTARTSYRASVVDAFNQGPEPCFKSIRANATGSFTCSFEGLKKASDYLVSLTVTDSHLIDGEGYAAVHSTLEEEPPAAPDFIVATVSADRCSKVGWSRTCTPTSSTPGLNVHSVVVALLPLWQNVGPYAKAAHYDGPNGFVAQLQGRFGWVQNQGIPVIVHAPDMGYTIDESAGTWSTPTASGSLP